MHREYIFVSHLHGVLFYLPTQWRSPNFDHKTHNIQDTLLGMFYEIIALHNHHRYVIIIMNFHFTNDIAFEFDEIFRIESYAPYQTYSLKIIQKKRRIECDSNLKANRDTMNRSRWDESIGGMVGNAQCPRYHYSKLWKTKQRMGIPIVGMEWLLFPQELIKSASE